MIQPKTVLFVGASVVAVGIAGLSVAHSAQALTGNGTTLAGRIASAFSLDTADVQKVLDQYHTERRAEHSQDMSDWLQKQVDNGTITSAQKTLIENKLTELQKARDTERADLETWASDNKIDLGYLMHRGHGHMMSDNSSSDKSYLQTLVDDGKITAAQKTLIENKQTDLQKAHDAERTKLQQWAKDNNIDARYIMGQSMGDHFGGMGRGMRGMMGGDSTDTQ